MNEAPILLIASVLIILFALPLVLEKVKMNGIYGIRIAESFRSEARWYQINRFGGLLFLLWGVVLGLCGVVGLRLQASQQAKYMLISLAIVFGGLAIVTIAIFVYASKTRND